MHKLTGVLFLPGGTLLPKIAYSSWPSEENQFGVVFPSIWGKKQLKLTNGFDK